MKSSGDFCYPFFQATERGVQPNNRKGGQQPKGGSVLTFQHFISILLTTERGVQPKGGSVLTFQHYISILLKFSYRTAHRHIVYGEVIPNFRHCVRAREIYLGHRLVFIRVA